MYSLSIHFGPNAVVWAFLFKEKEKACAVFQSTCDNTTNADGITISDDFGQTAVFGADVIHALLLEDLELTDEAKILRSLANARCEVKARQRAATDSVIRSAQQPGMQVLQPRFNG